MLGVLLCVGACLCLSGCPSDNGTPAPGLAASTSEADKALLWAQLESIERTGRAKPEESAARLLALLPATRPGSTERAEVLGLRALLLALDRSRDGVNQIETELATWPNPATRADLEVALAAARDRYFTAQGDLREAVKSLSSLDAATFAKAAPRQRLRAHSAAVYALNEVGKANEALQHGQQELTLATELGATWRRAAAMYDMATSYYRADQLPAAMESADQALQLARQDPDPVLMYQVYNMRGVLHAEDADDTITHQAYTEALSYAEKAGDDGQRALLLGNFADYLLHRSQYAQALQVAQQALPLARQTRRLVAEISARHNVGLAKIALGRVAEGREDVRVAITMDEQNGSAASASDGWQELGQYLERAGDFAGAIDAYHEHRRLIDQVLRDDTRKAVVEAQEGFEAQRRAAEIELLNRDNNLKTEQIRARDLELGLWSLLAGCVVLTGVLLALAYQRIRKTNSALAVTNARLKVQSERDPLTGLANRRYFQAAIKALAGEAQGGRLAGAVFLIDIDHFKRINDVHGHAAGDSVLVEVARRLVGALREDDLVVRWGGEEFLIVVKGDSASTATPDEDDEVSDGNIVRPFVDSRALEPGSAQILAQRLLDLIGTEPIAHGATTVPVTASIGFASFPIEPHGLSLNWERAIDLVDTVMYIAKAHGRNKAYGIASIDATDESQVAEIAPRMESAWHAGQVKLLALSGPTPAPKVEVPA
jgi:GGDEF domain-containing protein